MIWSHTSCNFRGAVHPTLKTHTRKKHSQKCQPGPATRRSTKYTRKPLAVASNAPLQMLAVASHSTARSQSTHHNGTYVGHVHRIPNSDGCLKHCGVSGHSAGLGAPWMDRESHSRSTFGRQQPSVQLPGPNARRRPPNRRDLRHRSGKRKGLSQINVLLQQPGRIVKASLVQR